MITKATEFISAVGDSVLPIPGGFRRGEAVYWQQDITWVSATVVGRRKGKVEVEFPPNSGEFQAKDACELNRIPGGFSCGDEVYHSGEPDPLLPDRAPGIIAGVTQGGEVMVRFPGESKPFSIGYEDLTLQPPGDFRPGVYVVAEFTKVRRPSRWAWTGLAGRPGEVANADLVPGTRLLISSILDEDSGQAKPGEVLGVLDPSVRAYPGQEAGDLAVLQIAERADASRAAVVGEPQPENWSTDTLAIFQMQNDDDTEVEEEASDEVECRILDWNGRRMQWKVQVKGESPFWADVDELKKVDVHNVSAKPAESCATHDDSPPAVKKPRNSIAEMMRRAGSLANFSPASGPYPRMSIDSEKPSARMSVPARRWDERKRRQSILRRQSREFARQLASEARDQTNRLKRVTRPSLLESDVPAAKRSRFGFTR